MIQPVYLDCNATSPIEPAVAASVKEFMEEEFGNAGSRTHEFGARAKQAVERARDLVAAVVDAKREEVIFTSGATEANNLAIIGLQAFGEKVGKRHVVTTAIEHKAILEPCEELERRGFEVTVVACRPSGAVDPEEVVASVREDTLIVSVMQVNNETGIRQPIDAIANALGGCDAFFHVDAAQGYGKDIVSLRNQRIDLISVSGHKVYGPKGVGALIMRRRGFNKVPLQPLAWGGGQERGLRPGTLPVPLIVGLGKAAKLASRESEKRRECCLTIKGDAVAAFEKLGATTNGDSRLVVDNVLNISVPGVDSEAIMVALKGLIALSNGSACTSHSYAPSHVLSAMGLDEEKIAGAIRLSWCHLTPEVDWDLITQQVGRLLS